jgi:hypothetical protein
VATPKPLTARDIGRLFELLNDELAAVDTHAELYLVGGAVMCVSLGARAATRDVDAYFKPSIIVREAAGRVALRVGLPPTWLNDAVKGWLGNRGTFAPWWSGTHVEVFVAQPAYLLAMKCMAARIGADSRDLDDIRFLLRHQNVTTAAEALNIVTRYFDASEIPLKSRLILEELLSDE